MRMSEMQLCQKGRVKEIDMQGSMRRRLQDLGIIRQAEVRCEMFAPSKDPIAFLVHDCVLAIRRKDADRIEIDVIENE